MSTVITLGLVILILAFFAMISFTTWRLRTIGIVLVGVALVFVGGVVWFEYAINRALERRHGPKHIFPAPDQTRFLEEAVAIERARQTLVLDGLTNGIWNPARYGHTAAPDGQTDIYLGRNFQDPRKGYLVFTNGSGNELVVQLGIDGTNLISQRVVWK